MFLNNVLRYLMVLIPLISSAQKRTVDTVYVYEEVIVHDTIYIEKPIKNLTINNAMLTLNNSNTALLTFEENGVQATINVEHLLVKDSRSKATQAKPAKVPQLDKWNFGVKAFYNCVNNNLFADSKEVFSDGYGIGAMVMKRVFRKNGYASIGIHYNYFPESHALEARKTSNSSLDGFYIVNSQPKLFLGASDKHHQIQIPLQFYYRIGRFYPSLGFVYSMNTYKANFLSATGNLPLMFDKTTSVDMKANQWGNIIELGYLINNNFSVALNYAHTKTNHIVFYEGHGKVFSLNQNITEDQISLSINYYFKKNNAKKDKGKRM
ncbi:hypothetical protein [Flavobacterium sp.]|uniref:hypothetical protein n=1 Tax=Flavobacterium sp. TaxID=239 RepID=UPI0026072D53|nr:hypothetical protein [Flavobacterium sp.]